MQLTQAMLKESKDLDLGTSDWLRIDQERIDGFAEVTEDRQWIHTDPERAKDSPFGGTIAHGFLVVSLIPRLFFQVAGFPEAEMIVNYGLDKLRFIQPVPSGSEIRLRGRLISGTERGGGVLVRFRCDVELKETGRRAVMAEVLFLIRGPKVEEAESDAEKEMAGGV